MFAGLGDTEKKRTKQRGDGGVAESSGRCRGDDECPCEENKSERVYSWQKCAITDWGFACGSIILKRDMRLVAMNEMRVQGPK